VPKSQGSPVYRQIADDLRAQIEDGTLRSGDRVPSEAELMRDFSVSRIVVRQAMDVLAKEGLITKERGRGSFVRAQGEQEPRIIGDFYGRRPTGSPFAAAARASGKEPEWEYQSRETRASPLIAERLGIQPGDPVMRTRYTFFADEQPVMLSTSYEPLAVTGGTPIQHPEAGPVTGVVARMDLIGRNVTDVLEEVTARSPRQAERETLGITEPSPVFAITRTYFADGVPVETADIVVSSDRYKLSYRVPLPPAQESAGEQ